MIIVLILVLGVLAYLFNKQIRKMYPYLLGVVGILSVLSLIIEIPLFEVITEGFIGLAFIFVVMLAGAFKKHTKISKKLRSVRKEYSIFGVILLLPHGILYILEFLNGSYATEWFGIIALLVMIPLFITSFTKIRRRMSNKNWKNLQKFAYLAYGLTFIHLIFVSEGPNLVSYSIIFGFYIILKLWNYIFVDSSRSFKIFIVLLLSFFGYKLIFGDISLTGLNSTVIGISYIEETLVDGVCYGESEGYSNLPIEISITIENGEIVDIEVYEFGGTEPHKGIDFEEAVYEIAEYVISSQSTDIYTISGATYSTNGLLEAVEKALSEALIKQIE